MDLPHNRWLNIAFFASSASIVALVGISIGQEMRRPPVIEQRIVPELDLVDRCEGCHDAAKHPEAMTAAHSVERFGCTSCHGGQGLATTADDAHKAHLDWERPLFTALEREANCGHCHLGDSVSGADTLSAGRRAIAARGCAGCHELPGFEPPRIAPDLDGLRDKVKPGWVRAWLGDPARILPKHKMPRFALDAGAIEALVGYLFSLPGPELHPIPSHLQGDAERGKRAVATRRCATCHEVDGRGGLLGTSLGSAGAKIAPTWLFNYLTDTHRIHPHTQMPGFRLPESEAADIVAYAAEEWVPDSADLPWTKLEGPSKPELAEAGKRLFADLGCRGCHFVASVPFVRVGMPLANIADRHVADLPRASSHADVADVPTWVGLKITSPREFDVAGAAASKMPVYPADAAEVRAIGVAVASMRSGVLPKAYLREPAGAQGSVAGGATGRLVERFRCLVCHRIGGSGGDISHVSLDGEGSRVSRKWLEGFLQSPVTIRMDQSERMPVLGIAEPEAALLAGWIGSVLADDRIVEEAPPTAAEATEGRRLFGERGCPTCHVAEGRGTMKGPVLDGAGERLQFGYAYAMLVRGNAVVPGLRHPAEHHPPAEARAMAAYVCSLAAPQLADRTR